MKKIVFPVLGFEPSEKTTDGNFANGTGFLINDKGFLFTAGHNFYKKERETGNLNELICFAYINNQLIEIEKLYIEYDEDDEVEKKDFAIGKLKTVPNELVQNTSIDCNDFIAIGYSIRDLPFEAIEQVKFKNTKFNLYKVPIVPTGNVLRYLSFEKSYENVLFFDYSPKADLFGLSGCPVIKNNELSGMLVSNCIITNEYLEKLSNIMEK